MALNLFTDLAWLPRPPADFGKRCRALQDNSENLGARLRVLADFALNGNQLVRLAKITGAARAAGHSLRPLVPFRLGLLGNATLDGIAAALVGSAVRYGIDLDCITTEYAQTVQSALSPESAINRARPDAVLVALDYRAFPLRVTPGDRDAAEKTVAEWLANLQLIGGGIRKNSGGSCIFQTLAPPPEGIVRTLRPNAAGHHPLADRRDQPRHRGTDDATWRHPA